MGALAKALNASVATGSRNTTENAIDRALRELPKADREALERAIWDWDENFQSYRVSNRKLADLLTEAGYPLQNSGVSKYRSTRGRA